MIPFCVTTLVTHDIKLSQYFRKITEYKESNFLFSSEFKMYLYISNNWCIVEYLGRKPDICSLFLCRWLQTY